MKNRNSKNFIKIILVSIICVILVIATIKATPIFLSLTDESSRELLKEQIYKLGICGYFLLLGIQVLQIVVAVLPGEPIEIIAGMLYGTFGGLLTCLLGIFIGSLIVYLLVKTFGQKIIDLFFKKEEMLKLSFLKDDNKLEMVIFILFFIPGTPKDILIYFAPFLKVKPIKFFIISTLARIPSVITSTYAGSSIIQGKWWQTIIIFLITGIIGIVGILFNNYYTKRKNEKR